MNKDGIRALEHVTEADQRMKHPRVGRIVGSTANGDLLVECGDDGPHVARNLAGLDRDVLSRPENIGSGVLLVFDGGDPRLPIIVGLMENPSRGPWKNLIHLETESGSYGRPEETLIDGKRVLLDAEEEIVLRCGQGSITIAKDGRIVIRGTHLLSRSSGPVRIKGGTVNIN